MTPAWVLILVFTGWQQVGVREAGDEEQLVSLSMERALRELDSVITQAFGMQVSNPGHPSAPAYSCQAGTHGYLRRATFCSSGKRAENMGVPISSREPHFILPSLIHPSGCV